MTEKVAVGDYVLIHTGFAIRRLAPEDGEETLRLFDELSASLREAEAENLPSADSPAGEQSNSQRAASLREAEAENLPSADSPAGEQSNSQRAASLREAEAENLPSADSPAGEQSNSQRAASLREAEKASQTPSGPGRNQAPTDSADDEPAKPETLGS